jgi:hypothetical protein
MTDLPDKTDLTSGATTEAEFQGAIGALYDYIQELVTGATPELNDIVLGEITPTSTFITVDTENDTSSDDLDNILFTNIGPKVIFVRSLSSARSVVLKHLAGGSGQLYLHGEADVTINNVNKLIVLYYNVASSRWEELWRNWGLHTPVAGDVADVKTTLDFGTAADVDTGTDPDEVPLNSQLGALAYLATINNAALLADLVITGAKIANATIAVSKLANSTAGGVVGFNASGVATVIAPGTAAHVLTSNGPTLAPTYQAVTVPSQNCVLLGEANLAGSGAAITWYSRTDVKTVMLDFTDVRGSSSASNVLLYLHRNGSQYSGGSYRMRAFTVDGVSGGALAGTWNNNTYSAFVLGQLTTYNYLTGNLWISGCDQVGGHYPTIAGWVSNTYSAKVSNNHGQLLVTGAIINGITFTTEGGYSFSSGKIRVWGFI